MFTVAAGLLALLALPVHGHVAMYNDAMYGNTDGSFPVNPLTNKTMDQWWFHGSINNPPAEGVIATIPSGGIYNGDISCIAANISSSVSACPFGIHMGQQPDEFGNSDDNGALHTIDKPGTPLGKLQDARGCGISIAYQSDASLLKPEDFVVISVNYSCPWFSDTDFHIPSGLPACPPGGCHCQWGWVHSPNAGLPEMYTRIFRCDVTGEIGSAALPKGQVARKCPIDKNNCTVAAKQPHYWIQLEGNNNFQSKYDPPFYNGDYGFADGAQSDIFATDDGSKWNNNYCDWADCPVRYKGEWKGWPRTTYQQDSSPLEIDDSLNIELRPGCYAPGTPGLPFMFATDADGLINNDPTPEDLAGTSGHAKRILDFHNQFRAQYGVPALVWNETLAKERASVTGKCNYEVTKYNNVYAAYEKSTTQPNHNMNELLQMWARNDGNQQSGPDGRMDNLAKMIWAKASSVGCGWSIWCGNDDPSWPSKMIFDCGYDPLDGDFSENQPKFIQENTIANSTGPHGRPFYGDAAIGVDEPSPGVAASGASAALASSSSPPMTDSAAHAPTVAPVVNLNAAAPSNAVMDVSGGVGPSGAPMDVDLSKPSESVSTAGSSASSGPAVSGKKHCRRSRRLH